MGLNFKEFIRKTKMDIKKDPSILMDINKKTNFLDPIYNNISLNQRLYHLWKDHMETYACDFCGSPVKTARANLRDGIIYNQVCGSKECRVKKFKNTCMDRFGVSTPGQSSVIKAKIVKTNLSRYGVENPMNLKKFQDKMKITNLDRYDVEYPLQAKEFQNKMKATNLSRYGVENSMQLEATRKKSMETCKFNLGVEHPSQSVQIKDKMKEIFLRNYGVENPMKDKDVHLKMENTCIERYGVRYPSQSIQIKNKVKQSFLKNRLKITKEFESLGYIFVGHENGDLITLKCPTCGQEFIQKRSFLIQRMKNGIELCTHCNPINFSKSWGEQDLSNFIESLGVNIERNVRTIFTS